MTRVKRLVSYVIIIAVISALFWWLKPVYSNDAKAIFLPAKIIQHFLPTKIVKVLDALPASYLMLGNIRVTIHFKDKITPTTVRKAEEAAVALAKKAGATALYVTQTGYSPARTTIPGLRVFVLNAEAIR